MYLPGMGIVATVPTRFRLLELLKAHEVSQRELERLSGVSLVTINAIANNRTTRVDLATLDAISEALHVEPGELLEREPKPKRRG